MNRLLVVALLLATAATPVAAAPPAKVIHPCDPWPDCSVKTNPVNPGQPKDPSVPGIKEVLPPSQELRGIAPAPPP